VRRPLEVLQRHCAAFLRAALASPGTPVWQLPVVTPSERAQLVIDWNPAGGWAGRDTFVEQFEAQAARTPDVDAVISWRGRLTYRELNGRANRLAALLQARGIGRGDVVGIHLERSLDLITAVVAVLKAGAAYLPLDPAYPTERLHYMVADSGAALVLTQSDLRPRLDPHPTPVVAFDALTSELSEQSDENRGVSVRSGDLIYCMYTSGSTGRPKGVLIEHGNVASFFAAMDDRIDRDPPGTWLAVTSLSFDISALELLWTLCRGFTVVLQENALGAMTGQGAAGATPIDLSLFYFASDENVATDDRYRLLMEGARFADAHGFEAVWTPERHFHAFGGLYPNPAITSAAIASVTSRIRIRAGSLVMPLHHPVRVAEDWSLVDNLSKGRVGVAFASGWHPNDFVLAPQHHAAAKQVTFEGLDTVRRLWRGETVTLKGPQDRDVTVRTLPRPVQPELPFWITTAGNPDTFSQAGATGGNVLTHLLGQTLPEVAAKIATYREARRAAGHHGPGRVTLMLHTFVGGSDEAVRELVRGPMKQYLGSSLNLVKPHAWSFPAFKGRKASPDTSTDELFRDLSAADLDALLDHSFERYFETGGLFGSIDTCVAIVERLRAAGVDEIACLIDFGVPADQVLSSLEALAAVRRRVAGPRHDGSTEPPVSEAIARYGVTHLQCTPSMAEMLVADTAGAAALGRLRHLLVGGEALPVPLASRLRATGAARITNMYGPTETTIWSLAHDLDGDESPVPIGRPIAGTTAYVVDARGELVPIGSEGELYLGGPGVARGYHARADLTAERFVPDRFGRVSAARLYRTGDRVRYRTDGVLEFLGRIDQQVKLRGHRIELGEIEAELRQVPGIAAAAVTLREDSPGDARLVAYVTSSGATPPPRDWQTALRQRLPDVMVPSWLVVLDALPLTPNGKVDRRALPRPDGRDRPRADAAATPPQDDLQRLVAAIWKDVLQTQSVGVDDNFFDLGGHSLLTLQIAHRLGKLLGRSLPITDLFRFPTVRALARHLATAVDDSAPAALQAGDDRASARLVARARRRERSS
jgi:natural product biosynthesis luciferase-like monooxygenase protein